MIAKGHDFPRDTLVGVVSADVGLGLADFRASERTFQLLTQVAGRAGRGEQQGEAIVQTLYPEHYSIQLACRQDYPAFYERELQFRRAMRYPPIVSLVNAVVRSRTFAGAMDDAADIAQQLRQGNGDLRVLGNIGGTASGIVGLGALEGQAIDGAAAGGVHFDFSIAGAASTDAFVESNSQSPALGGTIIRGNATGTLTLNFDRPTKTLRFDLGFAHEEGEAPPKGGAGGDEDATPSGFIQLFDASGNLIENYTLGTNAHVDSLFTAGRFTYNGSTAVARVVIQMNQR